MGSAEPIAIVGMGLRFPGASSPRSFWELLRTGHCAVRDIDPSRWDLSDLYDPEGFERGINTLRYNKFEPFVLHIVDPREGKPELRGDVRVYDCETGDEREVTVTAKVLERYAEAYDGYLDEIRRFCTSRQVSYFRADVGVPFDELILRVFRRGGFLR